ncbi:MAG: prepilin-type N-terminal cleavage/methylation domain-containing protein [Planctomycetes bacterium]|nr:prepilin-type N-terminal cleavage/methylation domain-containing protein [Planctomycetota bacterium]
MNSHSSNTKIVRRGFTLVEVMVVIAVIALLVSLVIVALKSSSAASTRTRSLNALREIVRGYRAYSDDNRGHLMPGYIGEDLMDDDTDPFSDLRVRVPLGDPATGRWVDLEYVDAQSYVWRLAPYVNHVWETFYTELGDEGMRSQLEAEKIATILGPFGQYITSITPPATLISGGISERPTFGMNSIFVGGDSVHGGIYATDRNPWTPAPGLEDKILAATRFTQVKNPARLIVFGSSAKVLDGGPQIYEDTLLGFCELRAPFLEFDDGNDKWISQQWEVGTGGDIFTVDGDYSDPPGAGIPIIRRGQDLMPVAMLDGSASIEKASELAGDMRRWNPFEVALREHQ